MVTNKWKRAAFSMAEFMIALLVAAVIMIAVYQTVRLQWQRLNRSSEEAMLLGEAKRTLAVVTKQLRNSGFNPLNTPYDLQDDVTRRLGIVSASPEHITFSMDRQSPIEQEPDGLVITATTLNTQGLPIEGKTVGHEIGAFRFTNNQLLTYQQQGSAGRWQVLANAVKRFHLRYFTANGRAIPPFANPNNAKILSGIDRVEILLVLERRMGKETIEAQMTTTVTLRNRPVLTPKETP